MPTIADVYRAINALHSEGIFENYALGGTMAALFYAEATTCFRIEIRALGLGETPNRDGLIIIDGVPVRFLEAHDELQREAVCEAQTLFYDGVPVRVMRAEHLVAFGLSDGKSPLGYGSSYFAPETLDFQKLTQVLARAGLLEKWEYWQEIDAVPAPDADRFAAKRRWHEQNARLPVKEKVWQVLQMQANGLPLLAKHRPLQWWEKPWDIEP